MATAPTRQQHSKNLSAVASANLATVARGNKVMAWTVAYFLKWVLQYLGFTSLLFLDGF
jgi:hypothetical protein